MHFRRVSEGLCRLTVLSVLQDVCQFCVTAAITARFSKADLDIVIAVLIGLGGDRPRAFQFTCGAGFVFLCRNPPQWKGGSVPSAGPLHHLPPVRFRQRYQSLFPDGTSFRNSSGILMSTFANGRHHLFARTSVYIPRPFTSSTEVTSNRSPSVTMMWSVVMLRPEMLRKRNRSGGFGEKAKFAHRWDCRAVLL